jgi:hypothetical protein
LIATVSEAEVISERGGGGMALGMELGKKLVEELLKRPEVRGVGRRAFDRSREGAGAIGVSKGFRPNAPRMITVLAAVALTLVGLAVTVYPIDFVNNLLTDNSIEITREQGWMALVASPLLLVAGSLLRGL